MVRKPVPPRIAKSKKQIPAVVLIEQLKARLPVAPSTFTQIEAKELEILPPTFTEKHLQTKKVEEKRQVMHNRSTKKQEGDDTIKL